MELFYNLLFICPMLFLAGIIDGVAGGGGIISLPAYIMTGMPMNFAYGCNKMQSCFGTAASLVKYAKSGFVDVKIALITSVTAILGSFLSTRIMLSLDDGTIKLIIAGAMCFIIALTLLVHRMKGGEKTKVEASVKYVLLGLLAGVVLGLYDGFFGPGGGTVAMMVFVLLFGYDIRVGTGNGKIVIVISNLIALVNYIAEGCILYEIAIPATICNIIGSYIGAALAVKHGRKIVKKFLLLVVVVLLIQSLLKLF